MTAPFLQNRREFEPFANTTGLGLYRKAVNAVPQGLTFIYNANPLGAVIGAARAAVLGLPVPWAAWSAALALGFAAAILGHAFFQHSRDEFADAL